MPNPIPSVPIRSTMFQGDGTPAGEAVVRQLGSLTREWSLFFSSGSEWITQITHAERIGTEAAGVPDGALLVETDRSSIYESRTVGKKRAWVFVLGLMQGLLAARPADLKTNDAGFIYVATDSMVYRWSGSAWAGLGPTRTGWTPPTATLSRTALTNASTAADVLQHLAALITDLTTSGVIGP